MSAMSRTEMRALRSPSLSAWNSRLARFVDITARVTPSLPSSIRLDGLFALVEGVLDFVQRAGCLGAVHHVDVHGAEHQHDVVELVGRDEVAGQGVVELLV